MKTMLDGKIDCNLLCFLSGKKLNRISRRGHARKIVISLILFTVLVSACGAEAAVDDAIEDQPEVSGAQ